MATYQGFASYDSTSYVWSYNVGTYAPASSSTSRLVFINPDGSETWINGTGLNVNFSLMSWTTLSTVEHRCSSPAAW